MYHKNYLQINNKELNYKALKDDIYLSEPENILTL